MRRALATLLPLAAVLGSAPATAQGPDPLAAHATGAGVVIHVGSAPPAFTSDAPPQEPDIAHGGADLGWLQGLAMPDIPVRWDARVIDYLEHFRHDPRGRRSMAIWLERIRRYGPMIREKLRAMGLPEDLVYVAMVESGFDPSARSGRAAVGLWQFVRRTGAEYGLERNHWVDERMDPLESTEAAGRYLRDLHERFGSWELALAAYNMGYGALLRSIRKYNTNDYWLLSRLEAGLPYETTLYVAKIMACAVVGTNAERFGYEAASETEPLRAETVRVPGGMGLRLLARAARMEVEQLRDLNPELIRGRTPPGAVPYPLQLPEGRAETFRERWKSIRPRHPTHRRHVMRFGESLEDVAHRYRTSTRQLERLNELDDDSEIGPGVGLLVPAVAPREPEGEDGEAEAAVAAVPDALFAYPDRRRVFYRVSGDDTAADVASFFQVSVEELRRWNGIDPTAALQGGMVLQLFVPPEVDLSRALIMTEDEVRVLTVGSDEFFDYHEQQKGRVRFRYTVQPGDTLQSIARRFGLGVGDLMRINHIGRSSTLELGQEVIVYAPPGKVPADLRPSASR